MRITKLSMMLLGTLSLAALLNGCGSSSKEGAISAGDISKVDEASCRTCHATALEPLTGDSIIAQFNNSPHVANGCQSCHGNGGMHNGVGPLPYAKPGSAQCAVCHTDQDSADYAASGHASVATEDGEALCNRCHTHEGAVLGMKNGFTGDKTVLATLTNVQPAAIQNASVIQCSTCHVMHEGKLRTDAGWNPMDKVGSATASTSKEYSLCTGCHTYINEAGQLVASGNNGTAKFQHETAWNRVIASTHYDNPATGVGVGASTKIEGYVIRTNGATPCFDCHGHEAKTNTNNLQGSVLSDGKRYYKIITPEGTTYTDWAKSAHAGGLLTAKYAAVATAPTVTGPDGQTYTKRDAPLTDAVMAAGADKVSGPGWAYYDWDKSVKADGTNDRGDCQRCHTSTGAANFMSAPATYDYKKNDFSHLSGWVKASAGVATVSSGQNELLYCWGCHSNAGTGALRTPGARNEVYAAPGPNTTGTTGTTVTVAYPDLAGSNVCMTCHVGREVGANITAITDADGVLGFVNSHYLTAGAQLFGKSGYEFADVSYANPSYFKHDKVGTVAAPGTGTNGPCAGCHMTSSNKHLFTNVTKTAGKITGITSTACATCHAGNYALTAEKLADEEHEYVAALEAAKAALASKGIYFAAANPYFFNDTNGNGVLEVSETARANAYTNWAGPYGVDKWKNTMGAAFNANLLIHDPGGYAHNRIYAKRLIWDSIDFIYNGVIDSDVVAAIDAQVTAGRLTAADATAAKTYLGAARP